MDWILIGWEKKEGEKFDYTAKLGKYYDWKEKDIILYDDFDPQKRIAKSAAEYIAVWEPGFSNLKSARHRIVYGPHVLVSEKIASSTLQFEADITNADGKLPKSERSHPLFGRRLQVVGKSCASTIQRWYYPNKFTLVINTCRVHR